MGLNDTPSADRVHIGIFGRRNAGKSSIINAITGQNLAIVSDIKGTTTDPVSKAMELLPLGPVVMIDTPGLDDVGELGEKRIQKSYQVLNKTDIAVLVVDGAECAAARSVTDYEQIELELVKRFVEKKIPYVVVINKAEALDEIDQEKVAALFEKEKNLIFVSAAAGTNIPELKELIAKQVKADDMKLKIVGQFLEPGDFAVLVVPIDSAAPKGRLILPQQQVIRDVLEAGAIPVVTRETELTQALAGLAKKPKVVITDSQAFAKVSKDTPEDILLTSFSILFSNYKGNLKQQVQGAKALDSLQDGDKVLIAEGCTHHRQCDDIGTVKMPRWMENYTGKKLVFDFTSGVEFPEKEKLKQYKMVVHCGGCTLNEREMQHRLAVAGEQNIPMTNYGAAIAYMHGILKRSVEIFTEIWQEL
ncbi:MAG: [FeFe] hydrogenase H-cluster maturation GTPase HydF [Lachnospiraceae bacterium]|nr:[FeFe] hydrogenase H-cluster maturation GTPase HydF [Lachnospiraceae bacterium]